ncbi:nonribosomal peptide synthetase [Poronia punctata]|nr:nonribosomal peptide synthetase [Poronia punctata]
MGIHETPITEPPFDHPKPQQEPPNYGTRPLPHIVDEIALTDPTREAFSIPLTSNNNNNPKDDGGWRPITFKQYANAINRVAHRIIATCGSPSPKDPFPTIAYIGPNDARYVVMVLAAVKAGYKALFISSRNSQEGQLSLFDATDCRVVVFPEETHGEIVRPWLKERDMRAIPTGSLESWFFSEDSEDVDPLPFPYNKGEGWEWEPLCVMHTSGSTGLPKPIVVRNGMLAIADRYQALPAWEGRKIFLYGFVDGCRRNFIPMPLFHAAGMYTFLITALYYGVPAAFGPADRPLSSDSVAACLENLDVQSAFLPPAILEDMSQTEEHMSQLRKMNIVFTGGGNLAREAGNRLVHNGVRLCNVISATEFIPFPVYLQPEKDPNQWQYFLIHSEEFGADWRKVEGEDDVYQLVCVRKDTDPGLQGFFYTFPDATEYDTKDLYKPHPTLPDHWIYYGRADNIIVFSNGEKLNPVTMEEIITDHAEIKGAVVAGAGQFQPCLILEPVTHPESDEDAESLIERVWPLVAAANKETVAHGQIGREFVMLSSPQKPFLRAGKGTIQRAGTLKLYKDETDKLYERVGQVSKDDAPHIDLSSEEALIGSIQDLFSNRLGVGGKLEPDADFFSGGVDSMHVIGASRLLRAGLEAAGLPIDAGLVATRVIYSNPTPRKLARYILSLSHQSNGYTATDEVAYEVQAMESLWRKYTSDLPDTKQDRPDPSDHDQTVVLTGSTGMLGSYMLDQMVKNPAVKRIICLNRAEDGGKKQQARSMMERGLASDYESKCTLLHADLSRWDFGLPRDVYNQLLQTADRFIHNAWPVNFNMPVESFEPHLRGVRHVADFASRASKRVAVIFISSIGTGDRWDPSVGLLPEQRLEDLTLPSNGYGRSKQIGSLILEDVARAGDFPAAIVRVGQVAGPEGAGGSWNRHEWVPSIIASSLFIGALPSNLGSMERVDWTPCESIAGLILDVAGISQKLTADEISGYYHGVNPSSTTWGKLAVAIQEYYGKGRIPELVSFDHWVRKLEESQTSDLQALDKNPGVKLLETYRAMAASDDRSPVIFDMTVTKGRSPSMRNAKPVTPELMRHWCEQWKF